MNDRESKLSKDLCMLDTSGLRSSLGPRLANDSIKGAESKNDK